MIHTQIEIFFWATNLCNKKETNQLTSLAPDSTEPAYHVKGIVKKGMYVINFKI